ncbi:MAG: hypothetical protein KZQ88_01410, partial [Candidatus Thiodiazotropha sp. (ex Dulcina madagascariensis)]|nr:hypothetical protein [Candidatus Thiodiazotropha sp. (ex Dulcina madagascariensis)]
MVIEDAGNPRAVAIDRQRARLWVFGGNTLRGYGFDGTLYSQTLVTASRKSDEKHACDDEENDRDDHSSNAERDDEEKDGRGCGEDDHDKGFRAKRPVNLLVNDNEGSLWLSRHKTLYRFNPQGEHLGAVSFPHRIRALTLDTRRNRLWLTTGKSLTAIAADGAPAGTIELDAKHPLTDLAYDDSLDALWVATRKRLQRYAMSGEQTFEQPFRHLSHLAPDGKGGAWLATHRQLYRLDAAGQIRFELQPFHRRGAGRLIDIVADPTDDTVWVAGQYAIRHLDADGQILHRLETERRRGRRAKIRDLAIYTDATAPELTLIAPQDGTYLNTNPPPIILDISDSGSGVDLHSLTIQADHEPLQTTCTGELSEQVCIPTTPLPEGPVNLRISVADHAGNRAEPVETSFTVDTQPPLITVTSPVDGLLTNQPDVNVSGSVNEAATVTLNGEPLALAIDHAFTHSHTLVEGDNLLQLQATDWAGNVTEHPLQVVLDTLPPQPVNTRLIHLSEVIDGKVTISGDPGSAEPGATLAVTNRRTGERVSVTAGADGGFMVIVVAEHSDELSIIVTDQAGNASEEAETAVTDVVPGVGTIPPDPARLAPPLSPSAPVTLHAASAFLYSGNPPIQTGVDPSTLSKQRVAVVRGLVLDRNNRPLPGVRITIKDHPEYGQTLSRRDGLLDMAVNGGGLLTLNYEKAGYLPVQRKVEAPWQDYIWADDVVMIRLDEAVSTIDLGNLAAPMQVAQGSPVTDEDGTRQATVLFPSGTTATMTLPDGSTQPLTTLNVRATEYTVGENGPQAMPAPLPPASGYTYAVELSVDEAIAAGAKRVDFNTPLPLYVDNFLDFPVGQPVPVGYYDFDKTAWVPSDNGRIVRILRIDNGRAVLDTNGEGEPATADELAILGVTNQELVMLAGLYEAGKALWRSPVTHFTPWDCNWPYGPPDDAKPPEPPPTPKDNDPSDADCANNSIIVCQSQLLGESLPITGTTFSLNYRSRVPGRRVDNSMTIPLIGENSSPSLKGIEVEVFIGGKRFKETVMPQADNSNYTFDWDGVDIYGRPMFGFVSATVRVSNIYPAVYYGYNRNALQLLIERIFAREVVYGQAVGRLEFDQRRSSADVALNRTWQFRLQIPNSEDYSALGGWTLDEYHRYDPIGKALLLGNGEMIKAYNAGNTVETYAELPGVLGKITIDDQERLFVALPDDHRVVEVTSDGIQRIIAGTGQAGYSGDNGLATEATLNRPVDVKLGANGEIFIVEEGNHCIRKIDSSGIISTVAGTGFAGFSGDGGLATEAKLNRPMALSLSDDGTLFIADMWNNRIRRVSVDGLIYTFAGDGVGRYGGDGGHASNASFYRPKGLAIGFNNTLYVADSFNQRIRAIDTEGRVATIAGNGQAGDLGDYGLATEAQLNYPSSIRVSDDGSLFIVDTDNHRIRFVNPSGEISTIAGSGETAMANDEGPATEANFAYPLDITFSPSGKMYIADSERGSIRAMGLAMEGYTGKSFKVPSLEGTELYEFDEYGRHQRTLSTMTGNVLLQFGHDSNGYVERILDGYGNTTEIVRDGNNRLTTLLSPDGHRTACETDENGYLSRLTNPNQESYYFEYTDGGLLTSLVDPKGNGSVMRYDEKGRLISDQNPAGGAYSLSRTDTNDGYQVELTSSLGRSTRHRVYRDDLFEYREKTNPDGTVQRKRTMSAYPTGDIASASFVRGEVTYPDGLETQIRYQTDARLGWLAKYAGHERNTLPSGKFLGTRIAESVELEDTSDPLSLISHTRNFTYNDMVPFVDDEMNVRTGEQHFDAASLTYRTTTPQGRLLFQTINSQGDTVSESTADLTPIYYDYDTRGRLSVVRTGEGAEERRTSITYGQDGYIREIRDPLDRIFGFEHDAVGRLTEQSMPDGRTISYRYDENGNLAAVTPPGRSAHAFGYTPIDFEASYTPPDIGADAGATRYEYNLDKQMTSILRSDGLGMNMAYDAGGRLSGMSIPRGQFAYNYNDQTGKVTSLTAPDGGELSFEYDGPLVIAESWSGQISGAVAHQFNGRFLQIGQNVNGDAINSSYDDDDLIVQAGDLIITRDDAGLITGTLLEPIRSALSYNGFGELASESVTQQISGLDAIVEGQNISSDSLQVAGRIIGATSVTINGLPMQVASDGTLSGDVPLELNDNILTIEVANASGRTVAQLERTVRRVPAQSTYQVSEIVEISPAGDIYFAEDDDGFRQLFRLPANSSTPEGPAWLDGAADVTVTDSGAIYLLKGTALSLFDGVSENLVLDLATAGLTSVSDIEIGLDGLVYLTSGRSIYRVEGDQLVSLGTLTTGFADLDARLEHSAWGLVVSGGQDDYYYRINADGTLDRLRESQVYGDFSLSDQGVVCWPSEFTAC